MSCDEEYDDVKSPCLYVFLAPKGADPTRKCARSEVEETCALVSLFEISLQSTTISSLVSNIEAALPEKEEEEKEEEASQQQRKQQHSQKRRVLTALVLLDESSDRFEDILPRGVEVAQAVGMAKDQLLIAYVDE